MVSGDSMVSVDIELKSKKTKKQPWSRGETTLVKSCWLSYKMYLTVYVTIHVAELCGVFAHEFTHTDLFRHHMVLGPVLCVTSANN